MLTGILEDNSFKGGKSGNAQKVSKDGEKGIEGYSEEKVDFDGSGRVGMISLALMSLKIW
jgi:hypothetical protein